MNRTQYEKLHPPKKKERCKFCKSREAGRRRRVLMQHKKRKQFNQELRNAIDAGKVIPVWFQDAFTGWHYIDYKNHQKVTGKGSE